MSMLRLFANRADDALFGNFLARAGWALVGLALGLWQGPLGLIGLTVGLVLLSSLLGLIGSLPAAPRLARTGHAAMGLARPHGA
ncbi:hypothetical protein [Zavarzinia sp.]|uniref:hypothetical protein n=1 Tax=Zavarzinia sp. TaxID=2027920 RepID=UPI003BB7F25B|nr:hypothetical protein [Zavarzinia sp.]